MSRTCEICGRGPAVSSTRSHSNIRNKRWTHINLQTKKIDDKKVKICTRCMKSQEKAGRS